jgi:cytochrome P450/nitrite reductase/ring-hydroxylating ferredoxin subunit
MFPDRGSICGRRQIGVCAVTTASFLPIAKLDELRGDGPYALSANGFDIVVVRAKSGWRAFEGRCPHQGALLGEGELDGDKLVCRNHRWRFSVDTGARDGGPQCLASYPVVEKDGAIFVDGAEFSRGADRAAAKRRLEDLPGPRGLPLIGNIHQLDLAKLHLVLEGWAAKYGPAFGFRIGPTQFFAITDPKWCEQVLRARPETFRRTSNLSKIFVELGVDGVFSADGEAWRPQRKLTVAALAQRHLRGLYPNIHTVTTRLKKRWEDLADAGADIDIVEELKRFTVDVTTLITFGHDLDTVNQGDDAIQRKLEIVFPALNRRLFALLPTWRFVRMPQDRRLDNVLSELRAWLDGLVADARTRLAAAPDDADRRSNFLEAMVSARDDDGKAFSDDVIFANLMTMLLAGEDTTAYTLGWAVHELCDSPESVARLRREADAILGSSDVAGDVDTANKLEFAGAVANETMRLRPVAPLLLLEAKAETVVGDVLVPAGATLAVLARPAALDAAHFADPRAFRPRRWLGETTGAHDISAHIPFGSGPRICPGRSLALVEMKVLLSMLYKNFDIERIDGTAEVREEFAFTMSPAGLKVRLRRRAMAMAEAGQ